MEIYFVMKKGHPPDCCHRNRTERKLRDWFLVLQCAARLVYNVVMKKNLVIILAGGSGNRIDSQLPKQYMSVKGKTILHHTITTFEHHSGIDEIFIVTNSEYRDRTKEIVNTGIFKKVSKIIDGGVTRQDSSRIGVEAADPVEFENVLIHDAARPFVSTNIIDNILEKLDTYSAINVAVPSVDTIIQVGEDGLLQSVPDRKYLRRVQTPQAFKLDLILKAHHMALARKMTDATDDCSLVLTFKLAPIYVVEGRPENIKITYPMDLTMSEMILDQ
jgi:ribitol-5-phosphate 2-dehydrogenase (NADP+) / D-ribitol-5-phosphate cytidylyltransferase